MALHFGKRETEQPKTLNSGMATQRYGVGSNSSSPVTPQATTASEPTPTPSTPPARSSVAIPEGGSKLTVGPNIKLKGVEITDCDTLVVEGLVEATMDSRVIQIAEQGAFKGSAEIDIAEIHGVFDGNLTVRQKLVIYATGRVTGKIRYGKVVIEEGGQLSGDIECSVNASASTSTSNSSKSSSTSMSAMALAA
ncbi:MAG: cell shape determination protein CcmA [Betaproteobacteria bacterium HGW-Betaproteobacteria-9]|jgi:cytoskeletal protein CcmA (bactofilin family)|nr:MAG: cell shape determination protein CcmA [Betaproteobacteria bacterium HGW-Betaproteobacteria-9]